MSAIIGTNKFDLTKATIYIVRVGANGDMKMAKPCEDCQRLLRESGIRRVIFSNEHGTMERFYV